MSSIQNSKRLINDSIIKEIRDSIEKLVYGTVSIAVHNSKITQIEITEKKRFDDVWKIDGGSGI